MGKKMENIAIKLDQYGERLGDRMKLQASGRRITLIVWALIRIILMSGLAFLLLYPLLYMVSMALRPPSEIFDASVVWVPRKPTFKNITGVIETMDYLSAFKTTTLVSVVSSIIQVMSCSLTGYGFARFKFKGRGILFVLVLITIIIPPQTTIISQYVMSVKFDWFGLIPLLNLLGFEISTRSIIDTVLPFYLPALFGAGIRSGLLIFIFRQFFRGMPKELEDSAYIDGAGPVRTFIRVMAPNAAAAFTTVFLFSLVWYWNDYFYSASFLGKSATLAVKLSSLLNLLTTMNAFQGDPYKYITQVQAGCIMVILPILIIYIVFQRYFTESIERTGIVG